MSNPSGNRWREGRPQSLNTPPPPQQRQQPPAQATTERTKASGGSDRANSQSHAPPVPQNRVPLTSQAGNAAASGNAWGAGDKTRAAGPAASTDEKVRRSAAEFNGEEVRTFLRGDAPTDGTEVKKGGTATAKPGTMANGQDFWVQLRKQITELEQGKR